MASLTDKVSVLTERVQALEEHKHEMEERSSKTESRVVVLETQQENDSSRLRRIEGGVWFMVASILVALLGAVVTLLAK